MLQSFKYQGDAFAMATPKEDPQSPLMMALILAILTVVIGNWIFGGVALYLCYRAHKAFRMGNVLVGMEQRNISIVISIAGLIIAVIAFIVIAIAFSSGGLQSPGPPINGF